MKLLTIGKILKNYKEYFSDFDIENIRKVQKENTDFATQAKNLKAALFDEEWLFLTAEKDNPWSQNYIDRINRKRKAFGVSPVNEDGFAPDNSSDLFCEEVVRQTKNYSELRDLKLRRAKQVVFVDMDNVLVDFQSGIDRISEADRVHYDGDLDEVPGIFSLMDPIDGAIEAYEWLHKHFDVYILSTAPWENPSAWQDKLYWVKEHLPKAAYKRLILSHNKHLVRGDFLIDDRTANGAGDFIGKHIHFGNNESGFHSWKEVIHYMKTVA